ncbi:hypothetical protein BDV29DRAFT_173208 [Aspergillus leporis]|uniref:Uncharacterized protein n=1 Tax=Aspergillus leporis TaxID=41062 RepID=A0A5N5X5C9_9EURO|nr:hypothetical protein BDV29DRAFT_173208 [Aspergillus leporis]
MCFLEIDNDGKGPCVRVVEYRAPSMRVSVPPPPPHGRRRRRRYSSSSSSSSDSCSTHDSTTVCPPRHSTHSDSHHHHHHHHSPSPSSSYTTMSRTRIRTLEESLAPIYRWRGRWFGSREPLPDHRCVEYVEPEIRRVRERRRPMWLEDVEYIRR